MSDEEAEKDRDLQPELRDILRRAAGNGRKIIIIQDGEVTHFPEDWQEKKPEETGPTEDTP